MFTSPIVIVLLLNLAQRPDGLEPIGRISDPTIRETSGIVKSRKYPDVFWIQSDSGNPPAIHAIRRDGRVIEGFRIAAANIDWEDLATDDSGHLYLAETGNNGLLLPIRAIYRIDEPDPFATPRGDLPVNRTVAYRFPSRADRFDAESLFLDGRGAFLLGKRRDGKEADLYRLPIDRSAPFTRPIAPTRVGVVPAFVEPATGAALSDDGRRLAIVSNRMTMIYDRAADGGLTPIGIVRYKDRDLEAVAWDGPALIVVSESGEIYRISPDAWRRP